MSKVPVQANTDAARELFARLQIYKDLKFYPSDLVDNIATEFNVKSPVIVRSKFNDIYGFRPTEFYKKNNLTGLNSKYTKAAADYLTLTNEEKKTYGIKKELLGKHGLKATRTELRYFSQFLKDIGELVKEEAVPKDPFSHGRRTAELLKKGSNLSVEGALTGKLDAPKMLTIFGKKGEKSVQKGHMTAKIAEFGAPGNVGYIPAIVNEAFGFQQQDTEALRDTLEAHMNKVANKFKNNKSGMYTISTNKNSIDQTRFNNALIREFGKAEGKVPVKAYLELLNQEAEQIGRATDGLITARPIDTKTFEFMKGPPPGSNPKYNIGMAMDPKFRDMSFKEIRAAYDAGDPRAMKALESAGNEVFIDRLLNTKKNLKKEQVYEISDKIKAAFKGGLINYENTPQAKIDQYNKITQLADLCAGKLATGGRVKFQKGTSVCQQSINAAKELDDVDYTKFSSQTNFGQKIKSAALGFLKSPGVKTFTLAGAAGTVGAAIVKEFRNDDPTTYLSNEDQQKSMLVAMATDPITTEFDRPDILDFQLPAAGALVAGSTAAAAPSTIKASKSRALGVESKRPGIVKTGFRTLGRGLGVAASPGLLAPLAAMDITGQVAEGDSPLDIATDPLNYLYPAFSGQTDKLTRGLPSAARKVASLGLGRVGLKALSRAGIAGLGLSLGIQGYNLLKD